MEQKLSTKKGIEIQTEQLQQWEKVLKPEIYERLQIWAISNNKTAQTGYDIVRGSDLCTFVYTLMKNPNATKLYDHD